MICLPVIEHVDGTKRIAKARIQREVLDIPYLVTDAWNRTWAPSGVSMGRGVRFTVTIMGRPATIMGGPGGSTSKSQNRLFQALVFSVIFLENCTCIGGILTTTSSSFETVSVGFSVGVDNQGSSFVIVGVLALSSEIVFRMTNPLMESIGSSSLVFTDGCHSVDSRHEKVKGKRVLWEL